MSDKVFLEVLRPERSGGWFGHGLTALKVPQVEDGEWLFLQTLSPDGTARLEPVAPNTRTVEAKPGEVALFCRVHGSTLDLELSFPAAAQDSQGRSLDVILRGKWSVAKPREFLESGITALVSPGTGLVGSSLQTWVTNRAPQRVLDEFRKDCKKHTWEHLCSAQVFPLSWWQTKLAGWLEQFGLSVQLTEARVDCAEAARAVAAETAMRSLEERTKLAQQVRTAELREAQLEQEAQEKQAELELQRDRLSADQAMARAAIEDQLAQLRLAYRKRLLDAEAAVHEAVHQAAEAELRHLLLVAKLRTQTAEAEMARIEREHKGDLDRTRRDAEQRLVLARMENDLQAIQFAKQAQAQAFEREAKRQEQLFQDEMEEMRKDAESKSRLKEAERDELLRQAQRHCDHARSVHSAASQQAVKVQQEAPKLAVLSAQFPPKYFEIARPWFFFGRVPFCHVVLSCPQVSSHHGAVARSNGGWIVVDHESTNGSFLNGERLRQQHIVNGDVLRVGDFWMVFALRSEHEHQQLAASGPCSMAASGGTIPAAGLPGGMTFRPSPRHVASALVQLNSASGQTATSDGGPILIGHTSTCTLPLTGGGVARFHAMVFWDAIKDACGAVTEAGVFVEDLHSGRGLLLNGQAVQRARLQDRDVLEIGGHRITVSFNGNVQARAESLVQKKPAALDWAITCVEGPAEGSSLRQRARIT